MVDDADLDAICTDYLERLRESLGGLSAEDRRQIIDQVSEHIASARAALPQQTETGVREILKRLGTPEEIAAAARTEDLSPVHRRKDGPIVIGGVVAVALCVIGIGFATALGAFSGGGSAPNREHSASPTTGSTSRASTKVAVPVVTDVSVSTAAQSLAGAGLGYTLRYTTSDRPVGLVLQQRPEPGSFVHLGTDVVLVVSGTQSSVTVPDVVGQSQAQAQSTLAQVGLEMTVEGPVPNDQVPDGDVFTQAPASGSQVVGKTSVTVTVSAGPG